MPDKRRILFVDDEQKIIDGLRRTLRGMRPEWDMAFAVNANEALEILDASPFDVIVSDMRMPLMDGPTLLTEVSKRHPQVVRIALSGHSEKEMILRSIKPAHQYLSKPCNVEELKNIIQRACTLRDLVTSDALQQLVSRMESIPSLSTLYLEIAEEMESPNGSMRKIGDIMSKDMGMTAKILQIVNSAFFGLQQRISDPTQAAVSLDMNTIKALVSSVHVFSQIDQSELEAFNLEGLWNHSLASATFAKELAKVEGKDRKVIDECCTSGLLHDVGKLLFVAMLPEQYRQVHDLVKNENMDLIDAERQVLGGTHAEIGGYLLGIWGLDDSIVEAVCFHHMPMTSLSTEFNSLTAVHVADAFEIKSRKSKELRSKSRIDTDYLTEIGMIDRLPAWKKICQKISEKGEQNERENSHC
ncbi:HDOD domain-containing protein [bacterium]|nr:HDOD domain-containing protein [bacterium]